MKRPTFTQVFCATFALVSLGFGVYFAIQNPHSDNFGWFLGLGAVAGFATIAVDPDISF